MAAPAIGPIVACIAAEPCGTILLGLTTAGVLGYDIYQFSKGGKQNVAHDYVRNRAQELAKELNVDYCTALKIIMDRARGKDSKLFNDAKQTYKQDCRGY